MINYSTFEDPEVDMVAALKSALIMLGRSNIRVATKRSSEENGRNLVTEVILRCDGELEFESVLSENEFTFYVYASGPNENAVTKEVSNATRLVKTALKLVPSQSKYVKSIQNIRTSIVEDAGNTQIRSILATTISRGDSHRIN